MLEIRQLSRFFGGLAAVNNVTLTVDRGEIRSIIGPNGAGKTTLFNIVTGAIAPSSGQILFKGVDMTGAAPQSYFRAGIVRSFQITSLFPKLSVRQNVELMAHGRARSSGSPFGRPAIPRSEIGDRVDHALDRVKLRREAHRIAETLSHGDRRLVEIAMALAAEPELLLLDEPTAGMSPEETRGTARLLRTLAPAVTVIIVEHDMNVVMSISDRISVLHRGELLAEGQPHDIRGNAEVQAVYFGRGGRA